MYNKVCRNNRCKKPYVGKSRNQAYCSSECQKAHYVAKKTNRRQYDRDKQILRLISSSYRIAKEVANLFIPETSCKWCGKEKTEVHHIDINPLNNHPDNLMRLCKKCHAYIHTKLPDINVGKVLIEHKNNPSTKFKEELDKKLPNNIKSIYRDVAKEIKGKLK